MHRVLHLVNEEAWGLDCWAKHIVAVARRRRTNEVENWLVPRLLMLEPRLLMFEANAAGDDIMLESMDYAIFMWFPCERFQPCNLCDDLPWYKIIFFFFCWIFCELFSPVRWRTLVPETPYSHPFYIRPSTPNKGIQQLVSYARSHNITHPPFSHSTPRQQFLWFMR